MKILHINTTDSSGSGIFAKRINRALKKINIDSKLLVLDKNIDDNNEVISYFENAKSKYDKIKALFTRNFLPSYYQWKTRSITNDLEMFTFPKSLIDITKHQSYYDCDIVHLHQVYDFIDYKSFFKINKKPIVWTFHDMNPFSGGWHIIDKEKIYSKKINKIAKKNLEIKKNAYSNIQKMTIISPSQFLLKEINNSKLFEFFKKEQVFNGIDLDIFKPYNKELACEIMNLPKNKKFILFLADDHNRINKGKDIFLKIYKKTKEKYNFLIVGKNSFCENYILDGVYQIGFMKDEKLLPILYSCVDISIVPSRYESFSLVTIESIACGVPVVAFDTSGPKEILEHKISGYLAKIDNIEDFINGIEYLSKTEYTEKFKIETLKRSKLFDINLIAKQYENIYNELI